jgi:hypothetical protein
MDISGRPLHNEQKKLGRNIADNKHIGWFNECSSPTAGEMIYFCQIISIFIVMITALCNLSYKTGDESLWTALLTSCLGYMLPNPKIKNNKVNDHNPQSLQ